MNGAETVAELRRRYAAGAPPSSLLRFLLASGTPDEELLRLFEMAFGALEGSEAVHDWLKTARKTSKGDPLIDGTLPSSMPPRDAFALSDMVPAKTTYMDVLRSFLHFKRAELDLSTTDWPHPVHAVVMETTIAEGSFSLVCVVDGTVSLYLDNGAHTLGAGDHDAVFEAASTLMAGAQYHFQMAEPVSDLVPTPCDHVRFYFVTDEGPLTHAAPEAALNDPGHGLGRFFVAAHEVIAQIRYVEATFDTSD